MPSDTVVDLGGKPAEMGHGGGVLHRGWVDLETRIRPKSDPEFLADCQRGEQETLKHYQHALDSDLPDDVRPTVERQMDDIRRTIETLRGLEISRSGGAG